MNTKLSGRLRSFRVARAFFGSWEQMRVFHFVIIETATARLIAQSLMLVLIYFKS